jgi:LacI family transcriptional regulator
MDSTPGAPARRTRQVTRHEVAVHAGVSDAVVSYTLNGGGPVAPATAARVRESVRLLGYTPNAAARALKLGTSDLIAVIVPDSANPLWAQLCHSVETVAALEGCNVLMVNAGDTAAVLRYMRSLASRQVDGVLLAGRVEPDEVPQLNATGVRWVALDQPFPLPGAVSAGTDLVAGGRMATQHLIDVHGSRRIAYIGTEDDGRFTGWASALSDSGRPRGPVFEARFSREGGYAAGRSLAAVTDSVDAVFASSDLIAMGVLLALHEADVAVPDQIAMVSFDGGPDSGFLWPALTTVRQPMERIAQVAVENLLGSEERVPGHTALHGELLVRRSCGCRPVGAVRHG